MSENVTAEIMGVVAEEAFESYKADVIHQVPSNNLEDLESNAERIGTWLHEWKVARGVV